MGRSVQRPSVRWSYRDYGIITPVTVVRRSSNGKSIEAACAAPDADRHGNLRDPGGTQHDVEPGIRVQRIGCPVDAWRAAAADHNTHALAQDKLKRPGQTGRGVLHLRLAFTLARAAG